MKENIRLCIELCLLALFLSFPLWAKYITDNPLIFPPEDDPLDWLQFFATYLGAIASFGMIFYTARSLNNNKRQLAEMKRQWDEEHKPEIIAYMVAHENFLHLCIKNISAVPVKNIRISVTHISDREDFPFNKEIVGKINTAMFSIEPGGCRYINTYVFVNTNVTIEDYLGLRFTYNDEYEYCVDLPFQVATFVTSDLNEGQIRRDIHQIPIELNKIANKH